MLAAPDHPGVRLVQISVPTGKRDAVLGVLEDEGIDYAMSDEVSGRGYTAVVSFPLPTPAVEPVLDRLRERGIDDDAFAVVVDAQTVMSRRFERLERQYDRDPETAADRRRPRQEIRSRASELAPGTNEFVVMTIVSVAIATAGVLLDSAAVVVGSMVIAPLIGPAMAANVGTVLRDRELFLRGVKLQVLGGALGVVTATFLAFVVRTTHVVPPGLDVVSLGQVESRLAPGILSLLVALGSGVAGAYSLTSGLSSALVGVAIAVALVPPTAVVGIGIAYALPMVVLGASILVLVNFLSINLGALAVLWLQGYRPAHVLQREEARSDTIKRAGVLALSIVILSAFLGGVTFYSYQAATVEQDIRNDVERVLDRPRYDELTLFDVTIEFEDPVLRRDPERVIVTVGEPAGAEFPALAQDLAETIDYSVVVEVRFTVRQATGI